jgi:hypothetical protein
LRAVFSFLLNIPENLKALAAPEVFLAIDDCKIVANQKATALLPAKHAKEAKKEVLLFESFTLFAGHCRKMFPGSRAKSIHQRHAVGVHGFSWGLQLPAKPLQIAEALCGKELL